ncbi:MAG: hypothetical protein H6727_04905 [Myxococcales bacterium]|nr:hypothetical protein [Myxococcales bacterium]
MIGVSVLFGAQGAGKTDLLGEVLRCRVGEEKWQVWWGGKGWGLMGQGVEGVAWRILPAGCACCVGQVSFQRSFVRGLREDRPQRVWMELPATAEPQGLLEVLCGEDLRGTVVVEQVITAIHPKHWASSRYRESPLYRAQIEHAGILWSSEAKQGEDSTWEAMWRDIRALYPEKQLLVGPAGALRLLEI